MVTAEAATAVTTMAVTVAARATVAAMAAARATGGGDGDGCSKGDGDGIGGGGGGGRYDCCAEGNGGGCDGNDKSCRGDGGMSALSVLPLLQTSTMKYQLISKSHPCLVKMCFLANRRVTAMGFYPANKYLAFVKYFNCKRIPRIIHLT